MEVSKINGYDIKDKKSVRTYDTVASMKIDGTIKEGQHVKTRGYYEINDGGSAEYYITSTESLTDYQEELNNGLYATLIVENDILNVKKLGAKADNTSDNTSVFNTALSYANKYSIYFPMGDYRCSYLNTVYVNKNIKIYGDNTNIKLLNNVITADSQRLFSLNCENEIDVVIEIYGLNINMNFTNNDSVIETSGDEWSLQHCHAIFIYGSADSNIEVFAHNLKFEDLIADGINLGGGSSKVINKAIINNIISENRTAKRSDVCITADFDSINCSNMILDKFEIEVNSRRANTRRTVLIENLDLSDTLDLDIGDNQPDNILYANNIKVNNYFLSNITNATYNNCTFNLGQYVRLLGDKLKFSNCNFYTNNNETFTLYSEDNYAYLFGTDNVELDLTFDNCNIEYNNTILTTGDNVTFFLKGIIFKKLEFNNCYINTSSQLINYRGGELHLNNNIIKTSNSNIQNMIIYGSNTVNINSYVYLKDNKTNSNIYLFNPPSNGNYTCDVYESNPAWKLGKVLGWSRFDKITPFNGGSGSIVTVKEFTEFLNDDIPNSGIWIKGQRVKNSNPSTSYMWICTATGSYESGTAPTFSVISI